MMTRYRMKCLVLSLCGLLGVATAHAQVEMATLEYWLDSRFNERISLSATKQMEQMIDVSHLSTGIHTLEMRVSDTNGRWGAPLIRYFLKSDQRLVGNGLAYYEYCIDGAWDKSVNGTLTDGEAILDLDISSLCADMHSLMLRVYDVKGQQSQTLVRYFLALGEDPAQRQLTAYRYWIDDFVQAKDGQTTDDNIMLDIDVNGLTKGLHSLGYQVADNTGRLSSPRLQYFVIPDLEMGIDQLVAYEYWFNHGPRKRVELQPQQSIDASDWLIEVKDVVPNRIPADYVFNVSNETVSLRDDVFFGMQVFNGNGNGSLAVLSDTVNMELTVNPNIATIVNGTDIRFASPKSDCLLGWKTDCQAGDSLTYRLTSAQLKADFYDANGQRLTANKTTDDDGMAYYGVVPHGNKCYLLIYDAALDSLGLALEVIDVLSGDVNGDRRVTVTDVVMTVNHIMGDEQPDFNEGVADLNKDGNVTMGDVVLLIDLVLKAEAETTIAGSRAYAAIETQNTIEIQPFMLAHNNVVGINLNNQTAFTAFQMDVQLPEGMRIAEDNGAELSSRATKSHRLSYQKHANDMVRIMGWSDASKSFVGKEGQLLTLHLISDGAQPTESLNISNVLFTTPDGKEHQLSDVSFYTGPTGIRAITGEKEKNDAYDLQGRKTESPMEGIFIVNGKKTIVKTAQP